MKHEVRHNRNSNSTCSLLRVPSCFFASSALLALVGLGLMGSAASGQASSPNTTTEVYEAKVVDALVGSGAVKPPSGSVSLRDGASGQIREITIQGTSTTGPAPKLFLRTKTPLEKATYLGIASTPVPSALREQLNLKVGAGILVERVEPDSPAQIAGIKQYDVVEKLDDQILINGQQLAILVRMRNSGEEIKLSIIRQGQKQTVAAKLVEKDLPVLAETNLWGLPISGSVADEGNLTFYGTKTTSPASAIRELQKTKQMRINILNAPYRLEYTELPNAEQEQQSQLKVTDTRSGNLVIFEGPVDTEEQRSLLPEQVRRSIGQLKPLRSTTQPAAEPFKTPSR